MAFRTDPRFAQPGLAVPATDEGLRSFMLSVYNYMGLGLAITGIVALAVASSPAIYVPIFTTPLEVGGDAGAAGLRHVPGRPHPVDEHQRRPDHLLAVRRR